jgi:acetolactate synthase small subunit
LVGEATIERHTIAVLVDNEAGSLARVIGLFSGRGYNIESLTVAETDAADAISRITIVTTGTPMVIAQIKAQLARLVPVHRVIDLTTDGVSVERELALVKVAGKGEKRVEALRHRQHKRVLRFRNLRRERKTERLYRSDGAAGPGRCFENGRRCYCTGQIRALESAPRQIRQSGFYGKVERCEFIMTGMRTLILSRTRKSRLSAMAARVTHMQTT